ncbi:matrixin family metalloprotease [Scytonema sp. PRP1]|uniref:matrixin family metalloprotease n=1 Tax=Scytonema sp. PRP1 TaxID=3120513 RepID=UPI002FCF115E
MSKQKVHADMEESASHEIPLDAEAGYQYCSMPETVERTFSSEVDPNRQELILLLGNKWLNGTVLHYYFFNEEPWKGSKEQKDVVREAFKIWKSVGIGLEFKEVNSPSEAEIRIGFMQGDGSWSYVGRDILIRGINERTMNFGWDISRNPQKIDTALHEIGHTLGFPHEHQNPNAGIVWDEEKVYADLAQPPNRWSRKKTYHNIIRKLDPREVEGSTWDSNSVMHYPFGSGLIKEPAQYAAGIRPAGGLSAKDRKYVRRFYPPLPEQEVELSPFLSVPLELGEEQQQNFKIEPDATRYYNFSTFGASDAVLGIFEKIDGEPRYIEADDDSGEERNASLRIKLFAGRQYVLRVRLYHSRAEKVAVMMW